MSSLKNKNKNKSTKRRLLKKSLVSKSSKDEQVKRGGVRHTTGPFNKAKHLAPSDFPPVLLAQKLLEIEGKIGAVQEAKTDRAQLYYSPSLRTAMRGAIGNQVFHMYMGTQVNWSSVSTVLGIGAAINSYITACGNWSSLASVFDAAILDSFELEISPYGSSAGPLLVAYDADNTTGISPSAATLLNYANCKAYAPSPGGPTALAAGDNPGYTRLSNFSHDLWPHVANNSLEVSATSTTGWFDTGNPTNCLGEVLAFNNSTSSSTVIYQVIVRVYMRFRLIH